MKARLLFFCNETPVDDETFSCTDCVLKSRSNPINSQLHSDLFVIYVLIGCPNKGAGSTGQ